MTQKLHCYPFVHYEFLPQVAHSAPFTMSFFSPLDDLPLLETAALTLYTPLPIFIKKKERYPATRCVEYPSSFIRKIRLTSVLRNRIHLHIIYSYTALD
uniref:Uncharacterized protein n=1 Tax=Parascaris univalens TaxID=6257 RepID=A0A914ZHR9_PARUN